MNKETLEQLKQKLEKERETTIKSLEKFAQKDENVKGDWDTRFPKFNGGESGSAALEKAADEVEEYSTLLPLEHALELKLQNINVALDKINGTKKSASGGYGVCEKCGKEIEAEKLEISPETKFCLKCREK